MSEYVSNITVPDLAGRLLSARRLMLTTHERPDGDGMGAVLALARALQPRGKSAEVYLMGPIEPALIPIAGRTPFRLIEHDAPADDFDLIIVSDTGAWSQVEPLDAFLRERHKRVIVIDHHSRGDADIAAWRLVDPRAVSTTAMLVPLLDEMKCELTGGVGGVAEALFVGLATDCGWFKYDNADAEAFALAARLLACGVDKSRLFQLLEETFGPERLALQARALSSIEYACQGMAAIQTLRSEDFQATGATLEDLTALVNTPLSVGPVRVSILLAQLQPGETKISFRSKAPAEGEKCGEFLDMNALAHSFGGGGHVHAAGARVEMDLDDAKAALLARLETPQP